MDLICPECSGQLVAASGESVRCSVHGGEYKVLVSRQPLVDPAAVARAIAEPAIAAGQEQACAYHPQAWASWRCAGCGMAICETCVFTQPDGTKVCPSCVSRRNTAGSTGPKGALTGMPRETKCKNHPGMDATSYCARCHTAMCQTCDFVFPGNIHLCPHCATSPQPMGSARKRNLIFSYLIAIWTSVGIGLIASGFFAHMVKTKSDVQLLGQGIMFLIFVPSIIGTALGFGTVDRRLSTPIAVWVSVVWNSVILLALVLLTFIGVMKK